MFSYVILRCHYNPGAVLAGVIIVLPRYVFNLSTIAFVQDLVVYV